MESATFGGFPETAIVGESATAYSDSDNAPHEYDEHLAVWRVGGPLVLLVGTVGNVIAVLVLCHMDVARSVFPLYFMALAVVGQLVLTVSLLPVWMYSLTGIDVRDLSQASCKLLMYLGHVLDMLAAWTFVAVLVTRAAWAMWPSLSKMHHVYKGHLCVLVILTLSILFLNSYALFVYDIGSDKKCGNNKFYSETFLPKFYWYKPVVNSVLPSLAICVSNVFIIQEYLETRPIIRTKVTFSLDTMDSLASASDSTLCSTSSLPVRISSTVRDEQDVNDPSKDVTVKLATRTQLAPPSDVKPRESPNDILTPSCMTAPALLGLTVLHAAPVAAHTMGLTPTGLLPARKKVPQDQAEPLPDCHPAELSSAVDESSDDEDEDILRHSFIEFGSVDRQIQVEVARLRRQRLRTKRTSSLKRTLRFKNSVTLITISVVYLMLTLPFFVLLMVGYTHLNLFRNETFVFTITTARILWFLSQAINFYIFLLTGPMFRYRLSEICICLRSRQMT